LVLGVSWALVISLAGCHEYVNPWEDDTVGPEAVATASVVEARALPHGDVERRRSFEGATISAQDGSVAHFPLWFEDPFETNGSNDGRFALTTMDYFCMPYGLGRLIVNGIGFPISAVVHPPAPVMISDGVPTERWFGEQHDAEWRPDGATPVPADLLDIGVVNSTPSAPDA